MSRFSALVFLSLCSVAICGIVSSYPDPELPGGLFRRVAAYDASQFDGKKVVVFSHYATCGVASTLALYMARVGADVRVFAPAESEICTSILADEAVKAVGGKCSSSVLDYDNYDAVLSALKDIKETVYAIVNLPGLPFATVLAAESAYVDGCEECKKIAHPSVLQLYNVDAPPEIEDAANTAATIGLMRNAVGHGVRANSMRIMNMKDDTEIAQVAESFLYLSADESKHVRGTMFNRHWSFY